MELSQPSSNRFLSMIGNRRLGFGRRRYGWLFLALAGLLVFILSYDQLSKNVFTIL